MQTQRQKVIAMLRHAGSLGVHTAELRGMYIGNPSQRINELRDLGYVIDSDRERSPFGQSLGTRYFLREEPKPAPAPAPQPQVDPEPPAAPRAVAADQRAEPTLFDLPATSASPYEDAA